MHCHLMYLHYYGSVWPEDDFLKSKLVARLHTDNKLMCFRLILVLSNNRLIVCYVQKFCQCIFLYIIFVVFVTKYRSQPP